MPGARRTARPSSRGAATGERCPRNRLLAGAGGPTGGVPRPEGYRTAGRGL